LARLGVALAPFDLLTGRHALAPARGRQLSEGRFKGGLGLFPLLILGRKSWLECLNLRNQASRW
jgi:hypothetical protein